MNLRLTLAALLFLLVALAPLRAQTRIDAPRTADPAHMQWAAKDEPLNITSFWFTNSSEDKPEFAQPNYDDSHWRARKRGEDITAYWKRPSKFIWYRQHIDLPPNAGDLSISLTGIYAPYQLYANGRLVGSEGKMDEGAMVFGTMIPAVHHLPKDIAPDGKLVLALRTRIFYGPNFQQGAIQGDSYFLLGSATHITDNRTLTMFESLTSNYTTAVISLIAFVVALGLALSSRGREYFLLSLAYFSYFAFNLAECWVFTHSVPRTGFPMLFMALLGVAPLIFLAEFMRGILGRTWLKLFAILEISLILSQVVCPALAIATPERFFFLFQGWFQSIFAILGFSLLDGFVPYLLFRAWRRGNRDAGLVLLANLPSVCLAIAQIVRSLLVSTGLLSSSVTPLQRIPGIAFNIAWSEVANFVTIIGLIVFMVLRTIRIAREKAELSGEIAAAHNVQTLLLARTSRPTPGFRVETAYKPASEVGGDFFLVSPSDDGSLFAIVGDVSGKGMQAAMRVSLILGVLHRESSRTPAQVLANLNRALLSQGEIGFTTACALHVHKDGRFSFANAGHLNPYLDGVELPSPGALPLGLSEAAEYATEYGHLTPGQRLVLLSDGVPEARSAATGDLYGFDNLVTLTRLTASDIAETAHQFGQTDDITVLTLALA